MIIGDAHQYLLDHYQEYGFIWSSPPCQSHSRMIRSGRNRVPRYPDLALYQEILFLQHNFDGKWVVENVIPYYKVLVTPAAELGRHVFWANFHIDTKHTMPFKDFINRQNLTAEEEMKKWLGLEYKGHIYYGDNHCPTQVLRNCVHPDMGKHVYDCMLRSLNLGQKELF